MGRDGYYEAVFQSESGATDTMVSRSLFDVGVITCPKRLLGAKEVSDDKNWTADEEDCLKWIAEFGPFHGIRM